MFLDKLETKRDIFVNEIILSSAHYYNNCETLHPEKTYDTIYIDCSFSKYPTGDFRVKDCWHNSLFINTINNFKENILFNCYIFNSSGFIFFDIYDGIIFNSSIYPEKLENSCVKYSRISLIDDLFTNGITGIKECNIEKSLISITDEVETSLKLKNNTIKDCFINLCGDFQLSISDDNNIFKNCVFIYDKQFHDEAQASCVIYNTSNTFINCSVIKIDYLFEVFEKDFKSDKTSILSENDLINMVGKINEKDLYPIKNKELK